jgi:hypothetical protein
MRDCREELLRWNIDGGLGVTIWVTMSVSLDRNWCLAKHRMSWHCISQRLHHIVFSSMALSSLDNADSVRSSHSSSAEEFSLTLEMMAWDISAKR